MRHHAGLGQRSTSPTFSEPFGDLLQVCRWSWFIWQVVDSCTVIHNVFDCLFFNSAFSTDGVYSAPYFVQSVVELRVVATSQTTHHRLLVPFFLLSFNAIHSVNYFMGDFSHSGSTPDDGLHRVAVVSNIFVTGCSSFPGLFVSHLIPHYPAVSWSPGEGHLVFFIMEGSKKA